MVAWLVGWLVAGGWLRSHWLRINGLWFHFQHSLSPRRFCVAVGVLAEMILVSAGSRFFTFFPSSSSRQASNVQKSRYTDKAALY